jgi:tripartite-type tricarboxylate transporter receptor subunit TctC
MDRRQFLAGMAAAALPAAAIAQARYPSRPIEFVVPWGPGGGSDQTARKLAQILEPRLNVSLPIVNIPGGSGVTGLNKLLAAPADGYTIYLMAADTVGLQALTKQKWSMADVQPVGMLTQQRSALFVREGGPLKTWADIDAASKAGDLKVAISSLGSPEEAAVNFFKRRGNRFIAVPYQRPGERYAALLGGHADVLFEQAGDIKSFIESGQIRPALILGDKPSSDFEGVPASRTVGIDFVLDQYRGLMVRAGTEVGVLKTLTDAVRQAVESPEYKAYLRDIWADEGSYLGPDDARRYMEEDLASLRKAV